MDIEVVKCPSCGGSLKLKGSEEFIKCEFCGNTLHIRKRDVNSDGSITIIDKVSGTKIGTVKVPFGFHTVGNLHPGVSSYAYPFGVSAAAYDDNGSVVTYFIGEAFCDRSKCPLLSSIYSKGMEQISRTHYQNFMDVTQYVDSYVSNYARNAKASYMKFSEERPMPLYEDFDEQAALENYKQKLEFEKQRTGNAEMAKDLDFYLKGICRIYDVTINNRNYKIAVTTVLEAWKYQFIGGGASGGSENSLLSGLGNGFSNSLFGNSPLSKLFGQPQTQAQQGKNLQSQNQQDFSQAHPQKTYFGEMPYNGIIDWLTDGLFMLQSTPEKFEEIFESTYSDFCSTFRLDTSIKERIYNMQNQILMDVQNHSQQQINQLNRQFQSWQQIHATQTQAFDSYNRAWWSRTNQADAARRSAYQSRMASDNRMSDRYSEAVRGVNTYLRDDGTEVEVSVAYDKAYRNNAGDVVGTNSTFKPSGDWIELERKW